MNDLPYSMPHSLAYEAAHQKVYQLKLEETADGFTLTFPLVSAWVAWTSIITPFVLAGLKLILAGVIISLVIGIGGMPPAVAFDWLRVFMWILLPVAGLIVLGMYLLLHYRRFGHISRSLCLSSAKLVWSRQGFWGIRYRSWDLQQIKKIELCPVKSLLPGKTVMDLRVQFIRGLPLRLRIATKDRNMLERLERAVAKLAASNLPA